MRRKLVWWIAGVVVLLLLFAAAAWGPVVSVWLEKPKYRVVESEGPIELRDYAPMIVAETRASGEREAAIRTGFRRIADYIFGNNTAAAKVAMTAPVTQQPSEKIAMTAPVTQQGDGGSWLVRFVMPASYTLETLPKPNNPEVELKTLPPKRFAVLRFSGRSDPENLQRHREMLEAFLRERGLEALSEPAYAFYNPPSTLPFLRRTEVQIEVAP
jgi:effector-binding domain-containing protein